MGKEEEGEGNQWHGRVVVGGSRESERVASMGAQLDGHGCSSEREGEAARESSRESQREWRARALGFQANGGEVANGRSTEEPRGASSL